MTSVTSPVTTRYSRFIEAPILNSADTATTMSVDHSPPTDQNTLTTLPPSIPTDLEQMIKKASSENYISFGPDQKDCFFFLCNDYSSPIELQGLHYTCATAAYEAQKFTYRPDLQRQFTILNAKQAFALSAQYHLEKDLDPEKNQSWWHRRENAMRTVLQAKFEQNIRLKNALLLTTGYLCYHTPIKGMDPLWTDDSDGSGQNRLGHLLMEIREGGGGAKDIPRPPSHIDSTPSEQAEMIPITPLNKTAEQIGAEIDELNQCMNEERYRRDSQVARRSENCPFTRFPTDNFPYDHTLVPLASKRYINASFILGKQFIGTQSPRSNTIEDFWSMALEHNVAVVLMLNRIGDPGGETYFPLKIPDKNTYGKVHLELTEEPFFMTDPTWRQTPHEEEPHAIVHRKLKIWRDGETPRSVDHFQYLNWRDFSIGNERAVAHFVKMVDPIRREKPQSPVVIHCHAGVGRTGVMVTLLDQYPNLSTGKIDIKGNVQRQRSPAEGRCNSMMQSAAQYAFCYRVLRLLTISV